MRGISSVFGAKRSDKPSPIPVASANDSQSNGDRVDSKRPSRLFGTITRRTTTSTRLASSTGASAGTAPSDKALSSSSSSSGSNSLRTPRDEEGLLRSNSKVSWMSWLGGKKADLTKKTDNNHEQWEVPRDKWRSRPVPTLQPPPRGGLLADETEDDSTSSESEDESEVASSSVDIATRTVTPSTLIKSRDNFRTMTHNSLRPPFSPPPLVHIVGQPCYPRSCNRRGSLQRPETLESRIHRTRILKCLDRHDITREQEFSIITFGMRSVTGTKHLSLLLDDQAVPKGHEVRTYSQGLQKWALRPCFEDRFDVWIPEDGTGNIMRTHVTGTDFGVAALEISESLDILAGATFEESDLEPPSSNSSSSLLPTISQPGRNAPPLPSPLRKEHHTTNPTPIFSSALKTEGRSMPAVPTVKRGVRFAEDDKDDQIPLGYVLRMRKKREEKSKFLQEEKERRAFEEDRARQEQDKLQREAERLEWEKEKRVWEKEKRAMDEERRQRQYAEEVAAARIRRDASRSGFYVSPSPATKEKSRPALRESQSARSAQESHHGAPRRQASDSVIDAMGSGSPYSASPASSNSPSVNGGSPSASGYFSRPASEHSANTTLSSMEDVQTRKNSNKRSSLGPDQTQRQSNRISALYYPQWSNPYLAPPIMPMYNLDMPLLPPAPPFMMQQSRRSGSPNSSSKSRSSSPRHTTRSSSRNDSSERVPSRQASTHADRPEMQHHRRGSSDDALKALQRPVVADRRSGSAVDIHNRRSSQYALASSQQSPPPSRSQGAWPTSPVPREHRGRAPPNRRQSVIN